MKFGCYQSAYGGGGHVMRESGWSSNAGLDLVSTAECPSGYVNAYYPRTKLDPAAAYPYSVGSNCGWGVTGHDVAELVQQVTGPGDSLTNVNLNVTVSIRTPWKSVA